ncbi:MAG: hypothetical protein IJY15_04530 [Thermoguttaceae bacterium]|nr:hypothetical protein [Thermoguttaceae bacterium]
MGKAKSSTRTRRRFFASGAASATLAASAALATFTLGPATENRAFAQLPPTSNRIAAVDSAVDANALFESDFVVDSFRPNLGTAIAPKRNSFVFPSDEALNARPFSVEFWARLDSKDGFHIFLANEEKSSPRHWELYAFAGVGDLALYVPGNPAGDTIRSGVSLADGKPHFIGLTMDVDAAELFVDGVSVARAKLDRPYSPTPEGAKFAVGSLVDRSIYCDGVIDDLRISRGIRKFSPETVPTEPLPLDDETLLLTRFDLTGIGSLAERNDALRRRLEASVPTEPASPVERFADVPKLLVASKDPTAPNQILTFDELGADGWLATATARVEGALAPKFGGQIETSTQAALDFLLPTGGIEPTVKPGEKPAKNIPIQAVDKARFDARVAELGVKSFDSNAFRTGVFSAWGERFLELEKELSGERKPPRGAAEQVLDENSLVFPETEKIPVQVVLRRTRALLDANPFAVNGETSAFKKLVADLERFEKAVAESLKTGDAYLNDKASTVADYFVACAFRRQIMFAQDDVADLDRIMFLARGCYAGSRLTNARNTDRIGGHMSTQIYGFNTIQGGGIFALSDWKSKAPQVKDLIAGKKVAATPVCDRLAGRELNSGSFYKPELSYDGKTIYFSWCNAKEHRWIWTPETTWSIFKTPVDGGAIEQLTDGAYNDFDVCELPSGRLVFCSERRGGFIRCFGESAALRVTTAVMHSMKPDGSDIYPISYFETSEWRPVVDNNGALVYSRWDYVDRENCLGSTFWTCAPDGRNPRSPQGNYPFPWDTFEDCEHGDHRFGACECAPSGLPMTQMQFRPIPDSHRYIFTAAPHHGETFGSLCMLDLRVPNDNHMSQIRRITPFEAFPESEGPDRAQYRYGAPWALSEDLYLCNSWEDLVLLDRYGNEELLVEREILPIGYDPRLRLTEPIPLRARPKPPVVAQQTAQGEDFATADKTSTIGVVNVNLTDRPFPQDRPIKSLRVLQVIPKANPWMDTPFIGYATENTPRIPLGTVPVEADGSAFFEAPSGKQLIFQALDEKGMAVQTMRSAAFVHPGENLVCVGCHEPETASVANDAKSAQPLAFRRAPSKLEPECGPVEPINYYRLIKPIVEERCVGCHIAKNAGPKAMEHEDLRPYVYYYSGSMRGGLTTTGPHGGSRSRPDRVGASEAKLGKILFDETHRDAVSDADRRAFIMWLDANALRLGAFQDEEAQKRGELVWPLLDVEPCEQYAP